MSPTPGAPPSPRNLPRSSASCHLQAGYRGRCSPPTPSPPLLQAHRLSSQSTNAPSCRLFRRWTSSDSYLQGTRRPEIQIWGEGTGNKGQWSISRELPKEDFPAIWESRSQGLGIPPLHYHLLSLFLGDHLLRMSIPRVLRLQTACVPCSRALSSASGNPSD